jgi:hypothetical protein
MVGSCTLVKVSSLNPRTILGLEFSFGFRQIKTGSTSQGLPANRSPGRERPIFDYPLAFSSFLGCPTTSISDASSAFRPVVKRLSSDKIELSISEDPSSPCEHILHPPDHCTWYVCDQLHIRIYQSGELEWSRVLPQPSWIQEHRDMLINILGNPRKYKIALNASKEPTTRCKSIMSRLMTKGI